MTATMWNNKHHFYLETVTGEIFSKKEEFALSFVDLEKVLIECLVMLYRGL